MYLLQLDCTIETILTLVREGGGGHLSYTDSAFSPPRPPVFEFAPIFTAFSLPPRCPLSGGQVDNHVMWFKCGGRGVVHAGVWVFVCLLCCVGVWLCACVWVCVCLCVCVCCSTSQGAQSGESTARAPPSSWTAARSASQTSNTPSSGKHTSQSSHYDITALKHMKPCSFTYSFEYSHTVQQTSNKI